MFDANRKLVEALLAEMHRQQVPQELLEPIRLWLDAQERQPEEYAQRSCRVLPTESRTWLSIAEAMHEARCCRATIKNWLSRDLFRSTRPVPSGSGRRLIDAASFRAFLGATTIAK